MSPRHRGKTKTGDVEKEKEIRASGVEGHRSGVTQVDGEEERRGEMALERSWNN